MRRTLTRDRGFTLVELLVAVAILAVLAMIAVPAFTRDNTEATFRSFVRRLAQDLRRAHYEAISSREHRSIIISGGGDAYGLNAVVPGTTTMSLLKQGEMPAEVEISGVLETSAVPGSTYTPPGTLPAEIRFTGTADVQVEAGTNNPPTDSSGTIFVRTRDDRFKARIVIFQTTAYTRVHHSW